MTATDPRVDAYLASLPPDQRTLLDAVRRRVATRVPEAQETFAYAMPAFRLGRQFLVSYAGWKRHCTIYPVGDDMLARHADRLAGYGRSKSSLHFSAAQPLPEDILDDIVRARVDAIAGAAG